MAITWICEPRRHFSFAREICNFLSVRSRVLIANERHGPNLAAAVATLAMLLKNGENVAVERRQRNVARPSLHFCFVRSSGCKTEQSD